LVLEDDIPTRPSGFCNTNQLFEINIAQAKRIDVVRGPGIVAFGSNAMHGSIDVLTPGPSPEPFAEFSLEAGTDNYYRGGLALSGAHSALQGNYTDSDSFRDDESFQHALLNMLFTHEAGRSTGRTSFAYAHLDQDTAGLLLTWSDAAAWTAGTDLEWANGDLVEFQENPVEMGSDFLKETRLSRQNGYTRVRTIWMQPMHTVISGHSLLNYPGKAVILSPSNFEICMMI
jgi:outer membrane receptor protein involved in Fe transport